jgi:hypothetical protein
MAEVAGWDFETLYPGGLTYTQLKDVIRFLGRADGRFIPFSFYQVRADPVRWAIEILDQVKKTIATASDFAEFKDTWSSPRNAESYNRLLDVQAGNRGSTIHWPEVHQALRLLESLYPTCGLVAVYGNLPTLTYSVLIFTPDQEMIPCDSLDQLTNCLRPFSVAVNETSGPSLSEGRQFYESRITERFARAGRQEPGDLGDPSWMSQQSRDAIARRATESTQTPEEIESLFAGMPKDPWYDVAHFNRTGKKVRYSRFIDDGQGMSIFRDGKWVPVTQLLAEQAEDEKRKNT